MSVTIETIVSCDGKCGATFAEGDQRYLPAFRQRENYRCDGWHFTRGKDYCPDCWEALTSILALSEVKP